MLYSQEHMIETMLSPDVAAEFPQSMGVKYDILRSHDEEVTSMFGLRKKKVKVIDLLRIRSIIVYTMDGSQWEIPLDKVIEEVDG